MGPWTIARPRYVVAVPKAALSLFQYQKRRRATPLVQIIVRFFRISFDASPQIMSMMRSFHPIEGRIAIATNAGWNAMDAGRVARRATGLRDGEDVWS
jgi:hypothetical protein